MIYGDGCAVVFVCCDWLCVFDLCDDFGLFDWFACVWVVVIVCCFLCMLCSGVLVIVLLFSFVEVFSIFVFAI